LYDSEDDAVEKITAVLADPAEQNRLREILAERGPRFSAGRFVTEVRDIVATFKE
jgi:hypothetical protein